MQALSRFGNRLARLGRRSSQVAPEPDADAPQGGRAVTIRCHSLLPPRHPQPVGPATADESAPAADPSERASDDAGPVLHSTTVKHRDPLEDRMEKLEARRARLRQCVKDCSWLPGDPLKDQTVLGLLMNMRMAADPSFENAAQRYAGIKSVREEISRIDLELSALAAERTLAGIQPS